MQSDDGDHDQPDFGPGTEFLTLGHVTRDITSAGTCLGGTAAYAACAAARLGVSSAIVTRAAPFEALDILANEVVVHNAGSPRCTTFENIYDRSGRQQYLHAQALPITALDIPKSLWRASIALFGPVAQELQPDLLACMPQVSLRVVVPQGWLRSWDQDGLVGSSCWYDANAIRGHCDVVVVSTDDLMAESPSLMEIIQLAPFVVTTRGAAGADVYADGRLLYRAPAYRANEIDPTGAGDVFAAAFALGLHWRGDPIWAADFACCAASFALEGSGLSGIASGKQIQSRMAADDRVEKKGARDKLRLRRF